MRSKTLFQGVIGCFGFLSLSVPFVVIGFLAADDWGESTCKTVALSTQLYLCIVPIMLACSFALASVRRKPTKLLYAISHLGIPWVVLLYLQGRSECAVSHTTATIVQLVFTAAAVFGATFAAAVDADAPAVPAALTSVATMYYFGAGIAYLFSSDVSTEQCSHLGKLGIMIPLLLVVSTAAIVLSDRVQRGASKKLQGVLSSAWAVAAVAHSVLTHHLHDSPCSDAPEWIYLYMAVYLGWAVLWPLFFFVPIGVFSEFGGLGMSAASLTTLAVGALCIFRGAMYVIRSGLFKHLVHACVGHGPPCVWCVQIRHIGGMRGPIRHASGNWRCAMRSHFGSDGLSFHYRGNIQVQPARCAVCMPFGSRVRITLSTAGGVRAVDLQCGMNRYIAWMVVSGNWGIIFHDTETCAGWDLMQGVAWTLVAFVGLGYLYCFLYCFIRVVARRGELDGFVLGFILRILGLVR